MTLKNKNKITDQAWDRLYTHLQQDGLLAANDSSNKLSLYSPTLFRWVASVAVLCLFIASVFIIGKGKPEELYAHTLSNEKNQPILVSTLEDGSVVYLSGLTSLQYPNHFSKDRRQVFLQGDAFFDVTKDRSKPFIIDTDHTIIEVLGTAFNVISNGASFSLSVQRGEVKIISKKDGRFVYVKAGETALLQADQLKAMPTVDMAQFDKYLKKIQFKDQRLADIIHIINANSDSLQLQIPPSLDDRLLTVTLSDETPNAIAQLICMALNLQFTQKQNTIIISEQK